RVPVVVLHACGHARPACDLRHRLAGHADVAGSEARLDCRQQAPADVPVDVLALPRRNLDRGLFIRLPYGGTSMSSLNVNPSAGHHGNEEEVDHDTLHITVGGYVTGFVLSVILTAIPFWIVMSKFFVSSTVTTFVILGFAIVQIYVHMRFFLH